MCAFNQLSALNSPISKVFFLRRYRIDYYIAHSAIKPTIEHGGHFCLLCCGYSRLLRLCYHEKKNRRDPRLRSSETTEDDSRKQKTIASFGREVDSALEGKEDDRIDRR